MELDFSAFELLMDTAPSRLLSVHPTEPLVALQVYGIRSIYMPSLANTRSAIWDRETYELVTVPDDAIVLVWSVDGKEMGLIREEYNGIDHEVGGPPRFSYTWERFSWPEQKLLDSCDMVLPTAWPESIIFSPQGNLVLVQWFNAENSGLEFIERTRRGDMQLADTGLPPIDSEAELPEDEDDDNPRFFVSTSLVTLPVFSPTGRYIVFGWQPRQRWWVDVPDDVYDDVYVEGELPVKVGACYVGNMQIVDWQALTTHTLPIWVNLPSRWGRTDRSAEYRTESPRVVSGCTAEGVY
ncbi:MAG: hypothetical protein ACRDHZ_24735 [Ktedonobacteraceae bacterium]